MLLFYTFLGGCYDALDAVAKEGYKAENFQVVCRTKKEAVEALEKHIKSNKKLKKDKTYYIYVCNAYEYAKYWEDTHFVFDYYVGDIKVVEGKIVPAKPYDEDDYYIVEYSESFDVRDIYDYEPLPEDIKDKLEKQLKKLDEEEESSETIHIDKPYDWTEKKDEIAENIDSALSGGEFKPIAIKISDETIKKYEEHEKNFDKAGFRALQEYINKKSGRKE